MQLSKFRLSWSNSQIGLAQKVQQVKWNSLIFALFDTTWNNGSQRNTSEFRRTLRSSVVIIEAWLDLTGLSKVKWSLHSSYKQEIAQRRLTQLNVHQKNLVDPGVTHCCSTDFGELYVVMRRSNVFSGILVKLVSSVNPDWDQQKSLGLSWLWLCSSV